MTADGGLYIAVFSLDAGRRIRVGRLGTFRFQPGVYYYVGSARRNREARLARHARHDKPLRWHLDYLSTRARMLGAILIDDPGWSECALAAGLSEHLTLAAPRFGSGDCRCPGHLFYQPPWGPTR